MTITDHNDVAAPDKAVWIQNLRRAYFLIEWLSHNGLCTYSVIRVEEAFECIVHPEIHCFNSVS